MKRYISLLSLIALFFVGVQQIQAQDSNRAVQEETAEVIAKKQMHELHQISELNGEQQSTVFYALVDYHQNLKALKSNADISTVQKAKSSLMDNLKARLKSILNEEQFNVFLRSLEKPQ